MNKKHIILIPVSGNGRQRPVIMNTGELLAFNLCQNMITDDEDFNENCMWVDGKIYCLKAARFKFEKNDICAPGKSRQQTDIWICYLRHPAKEPKKSMPDLSVPTFTNRSAYTTADSKMIITGYIRLRISSDWRNITLHGTD